MIFKKKKDGSYVVTWDSDASSSDDHKTTKKKVLASIAINEKPSLFDSSSCFMAKAPLRYKLVMMKVMKNMMMMMKMKMKMIVIVMMMNLLRMN